MSMSSNVHGFRPPDAKYRKMAAAYEACQNAGIDIPKELDGFFGGFPPDPAGVEVDIEEAVTE